MLHRKAEEEKAELIQMYHALNGSNWQIAFYTADAPKCFLHYGKTLHLRMYNLFYLKTTFLSKPLVKKL